MNKREKVYKFGIVGCGSVSQVHAKALQQMDNATLAAVCSRRKEQADKLAREYNVARVYTDYGELLKQTDIDVIVILTPNGMHGDMAIEAAKAGKHIIIEKPIDIKLEKVDQLLQICKESTVKLSVISQHRMDASTQVLKQAVEAGKLGRLILGDAHIKWFRSQAYYDSNPWRGTWAMDGGGVLINQGIHTIDLLLYIMGDVESVSANCATLGHEGIEVEDVATATLKFKNGALGTIIGTTAVYPGLPARLEIHGTKGSVRIEGDELVLWEVEGEEKYLPPKNSAKKTGASDPMAIDYIPHMLQIQDIIEAITQDRQPLVNGIEGRKALEVILAIYESAMLSKTVYL